MRSPWTARAAVAGVLVLPFLALPAVPADTGHAPGPPRAAPVDDAARLVDQVTRVRDAHASRSQAPTSLAWPAPGRITSPFGDHRNHPGIDIDGETGDPVAAAGAGVSAQAGPGPTGFGGDGTTAALARGHR